MFHLAELMKSRPSVFQRSLAGKQMVMFFEKPSLRTRLTFEAGMTSLGGTAMFVDQSQSRLDARETLSDIAHNLERWVDVIVLRTFAQETIDGMARYASVPVINALSDVEHPCQALADYFTLLERFGDLKKVSLAYVGDGNNVAHSLMLTLRVLGIDDSHRDAEGLRAQRADCRGRAKRSQRKPGRDIELLTDPQEAVAGVDAVYTDAWASMGQEKEAGERSTVFSALPGESGTDGESRAPCGVHALPAGASRAGSHRRGDGLGTFGRLRSGGKSPARTEIHSLFIAGRRGSPAREERSCLKKLYSLIPVDWIPPSLFRG